MSGTCTVADCGGRVHARGWCVTHYRRWQRHRDPRQAQPVRSRTREATSYAAITARLRAERGPATARRCADCEQVAVCWSYDGADRHERTHPGSGRRYSVNLDRYRPRCRFCHRRAVVERDAAVRPAGVRAGGGRRPELDVQRAARLYRAGASTRGIAAHMGVSAVVVARALRAHGVELRPAGRAHRCPSEVIRTTVRTKQP